MAIHNLYVCMQGRHGLGSPALINQRPLSFLLSLREISSVVVTLDAMVVSQSSLGHLNNKDWLAIFASQHLDASLPDWALWVSGPEKKNMTARDVTGSYWGTSKQHVKLQQPRNYDCRVSQFNLPTPQSGNDREMTTSPPGHHWEANGHLQEAKIALTMTPELQQLQANNREMTTSAESCNDREMQQPWNDKSEAQQSPPELHEILHRLMAVVVSSAFRKSLSYAFFSARKSGKFLRKFRAISLLNYTETLEKILPKKSSEEGAPKLQIYVPCRGRTCPEGCRPYRPPFTFLRSRGTAVSAGFFSVATPAQPRGERIVYFFANFGWWKTFRKVPVKCF